jgi:Ca2+-binding RTX toxin-like protein
LFPREQPLVDQRRTLGRMDGARMIVLPANLLKERVMVKLLRGTSSNDVLVGVDSDSNLFLDIGVGSDVARGGSKNDRFVMSVDLNFDQVDGGGGEDVVDYTGSAFQMQIDLSTGLVAADFGFSGAPGLHAVAALHNIEDVIGSRFDDTITGSAADNRIDGWFGNDVIHAGDGNDTLIGGVGINTLDGGRGSDTADYSTSPYSVIANLTTNQGGMLDTANQVFRSQDTFVSIENLIGSRYADMLIGNASDSIIDGGAGDDLIAGAGGNDTLHGGDGDDQIVAGGEAGTTTKMFGDAGNDTLTASAGIDIVNGGSGADWVDYSHQPASVPAGQWGHYTWTPGVTVDLVSRTGHGGWAEGDTYASIENVRGSNFNDTITGDDNVNVLVGMDGNDMIHGCGNDDTILGGQGDDTLYGDGGNDTLSDLWGANHFDGGEGTDTVDYSSATYGAVADLSGFFVSGTRDYQGNLQSDDSYVGVENVIGSNASDLVIGNGSDNVIYGNGGRDALAGFGGNDTIYGGDESDIIEGGAGADTLDGGTGTNTLSYAMSATGVRINLATNAASGGDADGDTISNFQNVIGSDGSDVLVGSSASNVFFEATGTNLIVGGGGMDTFVFSEHLSGFTRVQDFHVGEDRLGFEGLDSMQDLSFTQASGGTVVHIDGADGVIFLAGVTTLDLLQHQAGEFVFTPTLDGLLT